MKLTQALGLIETVGLTAAVEAADTAVKSADVKLIGYELAKGDGMVMVKIEGDVGAVKAAIQSAEAAAQCVGTVYSTQVIPRPAKGLEALIYTRETVGFTPPQAPPPAPPPPPPPPPPPEKKPDTPKPPAAKPVEAKPEPEKPKAAKPEVAKPEPAKAEVSTPKPRTASKSTTKSTAKASKPDTKK